MVVEKAFEEIINNSFMRVSCSISFTDSFIELKQIKHSDYDYFFILELFKFFESKYNVDLLSMYLDYKNRCNKSWISQYIQLFQNEGV